MNRNTCSKIAFVLPNRIRQDDIKMGQALLLRILHV